MATNSYPYNPYNAYKKIVGAKGDWHTAYSLGNDTSQYAQAAVPYYQELRDNGYGDLADDLTRSDYTASKGLLEKYGLKPDDQFNRDYDVNQLSGNNQQFPFTQNTDEGKLLNIATGYDDAYKALMGKVSDVATGQSAPSLSPGVQKLYDNWVAGNDRLNGEIKYDANGNVVSGLNTDHYNTGKNQLDYINNFDITKQPYYQGIMDQYKLGGQNAANGEYATGAASNSGNIDSYAAANANRQQLAFTNAGQQAALAAAQQNANNWQTLYSQMSQDLNSQGTLNLGTLQQAANLYAVDAQERMNALDTAGALAKQNAANALEAYIAKITGDTQRYGVDAETAMNTEDNKAVMDQLIAQLASDERVNTENNQTTRLGYATDERINEANNASALEQLLASITGQKDLAGINNAASLNELLASLEGQKAIAGMNNASALEQLQTQLAGQKELANLSVDNAIRQKQAEYDLAKQYGVTLDSDGNVVESSVDPALTDIYSTTHKMWNLYKTHKNAELQTPADIMAAMMEYDQEKYGGAHSKEIQAYVKSLNSLNGNGTSVDSFLSALLGGNS